MKKLIKKVTMIGSAFIAGLETIFAIIGFSMKDIFFLNEKNTFLSILFRLLLLLAAYVIICFGLWLFYVITCKRTVRLKYYRNDVTIKYGNIFLADAWRVIAMDTHFNVIVDDVIVAKSSLHGQLLLHHITPNEVSEAVKKEAEKRGYRPDRNGQYTFPLGSAIPCIGADGRYIMVALTDFDKKNEAHTNIPQYVNTLMTMWKEINGIYANYDIALPILGSGLTRFDDGQDDTNLLLKSMLITLSLSQMHFKSQISIIMYNNVADSYKIPLYKYKDIGEE